MDIKESLKQYFGFDAFRAGQEEVISQLMMGRSSLAVFPTGSGKSLCYQVPALHFAGLTLVISPLIALMKDQIDFLHGKGIPAAKLDSTLSFDEIKDLWHGLEQGSIKLLYVAPERFGNEKFLQRLKRLSISMMVVDEAHCMSEWGHNFRPDYLKLSRVAQDLKAERVLALTATATPSVAEDICRSFSIVPEAYVNIGYHRPNLHIRLSPCRNDNKEAFLLKRLATQPRGATIIYVTLQKQAENLAARLQQEGLPATAYHAGLKPEIRSSIQEDFMASPDAIVVATIAFGMGIDKSNIRYVYHYNLPKSLEGYAQEIGRAGRDGAQSYCEVLACDSDRVTLENFTYGDTPAVESLWGLLNELLTQGEILELSSYELSMRHDMRPLVIGTLLCYLELEGILQSTGPFYNTYKYQFIAQEAEILNRFDEDRQQFLSSLFQMAKMGRIWASLEIDEASRQLGCEKKRITAALNYLDDLGLIKTQVTGLRLGYRLVQQNLDLQALTQKFSQRFLSSEARDIARTQSFVDLCHSTSCVTRQILSYFGEDLGRDCGHCDRCVGEFSPELTTSDFRSALNAHELGLISQVRQENHSALESPRQRAKFFCGITSPKSSRSRPSLSKHQYFASLSHLPFAAVLGACD